VQLNRMALLGENIAQAQSDAQVALNQLSQLKNANAASPPVGGERQATVYFQFAGLDRLLAKRISDKIQESGWAIPGEERTSAAIWTNEIRYNSHDQAKAELLTHDANAALRAMNIAITLAPTQNKE
jgi:hypothetical protein